MPAVVQQPRRLGDLLDARALLHRVEDPLRARLGADPDGPAAGRRAARARRPRVTWSARSRHLNGVAASRASTSVGEPLDPAGLQAEDVVGDPEVIGPDTSRFSHAISVDDVLGRARGVALAVDRLRAPVAVIRAAARRRRGSSRSSRGATARSRDSARRRRDPRPGSGSASRSRMIVARPACGRAGRPASRRHRPGDRRERPIRCDRSARRAARRASPRLRR